MPSRFIHKNHYIDVHIIRQNSYDRVLYVPTVDVGPEGGIHEAYIGTSEEFADEKAAETRAFELAREWIECKSKYRSS
ncbi:MAG: hypothetical protein ACXW6J_08675 [Candidatus Binatia bacterium]